ncbi:unnamed protein product [Prunus armeniaca]
MLGGGKELSKIPNYSNGSNRCVERDVTPRFIGIGFAFRFLNESRLTHPKGAEALGERRRRRRGSNSSNNTSKFLEEIARQSAIRIEIDLKAQEDERAIQVEYAKEWEYACQEREYACRENIEKKDQET